MYLVTGYMEWWYSQPETTKKILKVSPHDKTDIYAILRWMMMNFNELRMKDNLSLDNKRLRCNEYIASLLTYEFSQRLNRVITLGAKATMQNFLDMFKFSGEILIQRMHISGILRFDDCINDMDFFTKCRYTTKGPNSFKAWTGLSNYQVNTILQTHNNLQKGAWK